MILSLINLNDYPDFFDWLHQEAKSSSMSQLEIDELLKKFEIEEVAQKNPNKLSSGQAKKVLLIQAILTKVNFLILDEPTFFLDVSTRMSLYKELLKMNKENNTTIFISSHILDEIKNYINSVTFIKKGQIK